ncbi:MAG: transposase [Candidatus Eremiobacteraeota bacterium]|nr:transposase [Candidatus Eremiobacteraeota bacterium]
MHRALASHWVKFRLCGKHGIFPAIAIRKHGTEHKSKKLNENWENLKAQPFYKKGLALRYRIEQKFGEDKMFHGLRWTRFRGIRKVAFQVVFTFLAMNFKRIMNLLDSTTRRNLKFSSA